MNRCGDSLKAEQLTFPWGDGGSIPTSPLQLFIKPVTKQIVQDIYRKWHYLGSQGFISSYNFAAYFNNQCLGGISFGPPSAWETVYSIWGHKNQQGIFEIKRLVMCDTCPKNSESRFIRIAIKLLRAQTTVRAIITYADSRQGHTGIIYRASNFTYRGLTKPKKDFWINGKIQQRGPTKGKPGIWKERSQKHLFIMEYR